MVNYDVDNAGRTNKVYAAGKTYADLTASGKDSFTPDGRIAEMRLVNNLWVAGDYAAPGSPTMYKLGTSQGASDLLKLEYHFSGTANNGNVLKQVIQRPGGSWSQSYSYDGVNRLTGAVETGGFNRTYGYDRYGNRWVDSSSGFCYRSVLYNEKLTRKLRLI